MVDYFEIDRSIVAVSMYCQDRFLGTEIGKVARNNRTIFRVASVTSLYIAIKLRVPHEWNVTAHAFAELCRGSVSGIDIKNMEMKILFALGWNINPPLPIEYSEGYLDLIFTSKGGQMQRTSPIPAPPLCGSTSSQDFDVSKDSSSSAGSGSQDGTGSLQELKDHILELVQYQLEIALQDRRLFQAQSSVIATAALLNALEGIVNEKPPFYDGVGGASFCQDSMALLSGSDKETEDVRSALLSSVVSLPKGSEGASDAQSSVTHSSHIRNQAELSSSGTPSSPTSASKFWSHASLTPLSVLTKVFASHNI